MSEKKDLKIHNLFLGTFLGHSLSVLFFIHCFLTQKKTPEKCPWKIPNNGTQIKEPNKNFLNTL